MFQVFLDLLDYRENDTAVAIVHLAAIRIMINRF